MDVLFWSGGKDSYLALQLFLEYEGTSEPKLLTTYEEDTHRVPHQNLALSTIQKQAHSLGLDLITVALPAQCPNDLYLHKVEHALRKDDQDIGRLIFGDWHLQDIKAWREKVFGEMGYECLFPIWQKSLDELLPILLFKPVEIRISAVAEEYRKYLAVGEAYNQQLVRQLPDSIDPMGEKGEFHTEVIFKDFPHPT